MKELIGCLIATTLLSIALGVGCTRSAAYPTDSVVWTATPSATPAPTNVPTFPGSQTATHTVTVTPTLTTTSTATSTPTSSSTATPQASQPAVVLNSAANYVILSYTGISNSGPSTTCGGYGVYPDGMTSVTGSPAIVENCGGSIDVGDAAADTAKGDLSTAYTDASTRPGGAVLASNADLGGLTLYPGLYSESGNLFIQSNNVTLDGQNNPNAVFIFQVAGYMEVFTNRQVLLTNQAQAKNVFWAVAGYCALDSYCSMEGIIMTYTSVTFGTGAVLTGRALAENGDVTLLTNTITHP